MPRNQMKKKLGPAKVIEQHFSIDQVAAKLSVGRSTVERLLYAGKLGYCQVGRRRIISETDLGNYLALIRHETTADRSY
jgi:excisionase family DNA binding protein